LSHVSSPPKFPLQGSTLPVLHCAHATSIARSEIIRLFLHARCASKKNGQAASTRSPFLKNDKDGTGHHAKANEIVPFDRLFKIEHRKNAKHDEGNDFLNGFQLGRREFSALMIHERFYCNHGYTAAAGGFAAQSVNVL
jgi:hypothetical protein